MEESNAKSGDQIILGQHGRGKRKSRQPGMEKCRETV
jgi:hypothetical protein